MEKVGQNGLFNKYKNKLNIIQEIRELAEEDARKAWNLYIIKDVYLNSRESLHLKRHIEKKASQQHITL